MTSMGIKIVPLNKSFIIEKLGIYNKTLEAGIHFIIPFVDRGAKEVDLSEKNYQTNEGAFQTFDDQLLTLKVKVTYQVIDPKLYNYGFDGDFYKVQEIGFDELRYIILKNTVQDVKLDLLNLENQMISQMSEKGRLWGIGILKVQIML